MSVDAQELPMTLRRPIVELVQELTVFGVVGLVCVALDIALFNALTFGAGLNPVLAKVLTMIVTGTVAFVGHRHVTFRQRHRAGHLREAVPFVLITLATFVVSLIPIWIVRWAGMDGVLALNVANLVAIGGGSMLRFVAYRRYVWTEPTRHEPVSVL